jgi:hypothetical protein
MADIKTKHDNYCDYACIFNEKILPEKKKFVNPEAQKMPNVEKNVVINALKIQKGGKPVTYFKQINQFGREVGTGGRAPTNFR